MTSQTKETDMTAEQRISEATRIVQQEKGAMEYCKYCTDSQLWDIICFRYYTPSDLVGAARREQQNRLISAAAKATEVYGDDELERFAAKQDSQ
jgi:hypothetical protein